MKKAKYNKGLSVKRYKRGNTKGWVCEGYLQDESGKLKRVRKFFSRGTDEDNQEAARGYRNELEAGAKQESLKDQYRRTRLNEETEFTVNSLVKKLRDELKDEDSTDHELLQRAVQFFIDSPLRGIKLTTLGEGCRIFVERDKFENLSTKSKSRYKSQIKVLLDRFGEDKPIEQISEQQLEKLIKDSEFESVHLTRWSSYSCLWNEFVKRRIINDHIVSRIDKPVWKKRTVTEAISIDTLEQLFLFADKIGKNKDQIPYIALASFAALRPEEVKRARWEDIHWEDKTIQARQNKNGTSFRNVDLPDNVIEWFKYYNPDAEQLTGKICKNTDKQFSLIKILAGYNLSKGSIESTKLWGFDDLVEEQCSKKDRPEWVADVLRHTGITYRLKSKGEWNEHRVAEWAGNSVKVCRKHYKSVKDVTQKTYEQYWSLTPKKLGLTK